MWTIITRDATKIWSKRDKCFIPKSMAENLPKNVCGFGTAEEAESEAKEWVPDNAYYINYVPHVCAGGFLR